MGVKHSLYMHMTSISKNINTEKHTSWHVIRTSPNGDASATKELKQEGLEAYSPCITSYCNQKNTYKEIPLFPGYIFLKCSVSQEMRPSLQTAPHASNWVVFGDEIPSISDDTVSLIKRYTETLNYQSKLPKRFERGDKVTVQLKDVKIPGEVIETAKPGSANVRVALEFVNTTAQAQVSKRYVEITAPERIRIPRRTRGRGRKIKPHHTQE